MHEDNKVSRKEEEETNPRCGHLLRPIKTVWRGGPASGTMTLNWSSTAQIQSVARSVRMMVIRWCSDPPPPVPFLSSTRFHKLPMPSSSPSIQLGGANVYISSNFDCESSFELSACKYRPIRHESAPLLMPGPARQLVRSLKRKKKKKERSSSCHESKKGKGEFYMV